MGVCHRIGAERWQRPVSRSYENRCCRHYHPVAVAVAVAVVVILAALVAAAWAGCWWSHRYCLIIYMIHHRCHRQQRPLAARRSPSPPPLATIGTATVVIMIALIKITRRYDTFLSTVWAEAMGMGMDGHGWAWMGMDGQTDERMNGWTKRSTDRQTDGRKGGETG